MSAYPQDESYSSQDQYPTVASSANFEVWEDKEEGSYILAFNLNGVTVEVDRELFEEFSRVVADAAEHDRSQGAAS